MEHIILPCNHSEIHNFNYIAGSKIFSQEKDRMFHIICNSESSMSFIKILDSYLDYFCSDIKYDLYNVGCSKQGYKKQTFHAVLNVIDKLSIDDEIILLTSERRFNQIVFSYTQKGYKIKQVYNPLYCSIAEFGKVTGYKSDVFDIFSMGEPETSYVFEDDKVYDKPLNYTQHHKDYQRFQVDMTDQLMELYTQLYLGKSKEYVSFTAYEKYRYIKEFEHKYAGTEWDGSDYDPRKLESTMKIFYGVEDYMKSHNIEDTFEYK